MLRSAVRAKNAYHLYQCIATIHFVLHDVRAPATTVTTVTTTTHTNSHTHSQISFHMRRRQERRNDYSLSLLQQTNQQLLIFTLYIFFTLYWKKNKNIENEIESWYYNESFQSFWKENLIRATKALAVLVDDWSKKEHGKKNVLMLLVVVKKFSVKVVKTFFFIPQHTSKHHHHCCTWWWVPVLMCSDIFLNSGLTANSIATTWFIFSSLLRCPLVWDNLFSLILFLLGWENRCAAFWQS